MLTLITNTLKQKLQNMSRLKPVVAFIATIRNNNGRLNPVILDIHRKLSDNKKGFKAEKVY
ncbi:hypothetical protein HYE32_00870 [Mycoplasmopsis bovis]|nr:hypothetical protein [Mycoplasmopsis bovis]QQH22205.1 hypothetical protein HYE32_00870 [Mycoplasmopsis bovis]